MGRTVRRMAGEPGVLEARLLGILGPWGRRPFCKRAPSPAKSRLLGILTDSCGGLSRKAGFPRPLLQKAGAFRGPRTPQWLREAPPPLIGQNAPYTPPRFVNYKKNRGTTAIRMQSFPLFFPLKVLERWGSGGGKPFSKGFSPPPIPRLLGILGPWGRGPFCKRAPSPKPPSPKTLGEGIAGK